MKKVKKILIILMMVISLFIAMVLKSNTNASIDITKADLYSTRNICKSNKIWRYRIRNRLCSIQKRWSGISSILFRHKCAWSTWK